jgi:hydroxymethylbilane synthase
MPANLKTVVLGTRTSPLALAQTYLAADALRSLAHVPNIRIEGIRTTGDQRLDINLSKSAARLEKGLFTKELEDALISGKIDVAVHSLKDLPTVLPVGLELVATLPRHDPVDLLISKTAHGLNEIPPGSFVATGSVRRARQIQRLRPDLFIEDVRGNVATRIRKLLGDKSWNSIVLAKAGLERLGYKLESGQVSFEGERLFATALGEILPAAGQGAIGLETRCNEPELRNLLRAVNDANTWFCTAVEREFLRLLGGGCNLPVGIRARLNGRKLNCEAIVFDEHGNWFSGALSEEFETAETAAAALLKRVYEQRR